MILSDAEIRRRLVNGSLKIRPLEDSQIQPNGVDLRIGREFMQPPRGKVVKADSYTLPANGRVLAVTLEHLEMPRDLVGFIFLRSSYARLGITIPPTAVDAGYRGLLTLLVVGGPKPSKLKAGERLWHLLLCEAHPAAKPYTGKYQASARLEPYRPDPATS